MTTTTLERPQAYESFFVRNIHCAGCADTLRHVVASLPGVHTVHVDPMIGWTRVDFDPDKTTGDELLAAVEAGGYEIVRTWS